MSYSTAGVTLTGTQLQYSKKKPVQSNSVRNVIKEGTGKPVDDTYHQGAENVHTRER